MVSLILRFVMVSVIFVGLGFLVLRFKARGIYRETLTQGYRSLEVMMIS